MGADTAATGNPASDLLDVAAAAPYLGVPETYVRGIVLEKRVAYYKLGKYLRFKRSDLDALVDAGRVESATPIADPQQLPVHRGVTALNKE